MICPKCGQEAQDDLVSCSSCGIIFIKWMIRQHRLRKEEGLGARGSELKKILLRLPRQFTRRFLAAAVLLSFAAGLLISFLLLRGPSPESPARISLRTVEKRTASILEEARAQAKPYGVTVNAADFSDFFKQGFESLNSKNLLAAAADSGRELSTRLGNLKEDRAHEDRPFKCRLGGVWFFFEESPSRAGFQECWLMTRRLRPGGKGRAPRWDIQWRKLSWSPERGRWALFTRQEEEELFAAYIESRFGKSAQDADLAAAQKLLQATVPKDELKRGLLRAYLTRMRREGARYRLESLR